MTISEDYLKMLDMERDLKAWLKEAHPPEKMMLLAGPRQVGKTTLAKQFLDMWPDKGAYFNWDISRHRKAILSGQDLLAESRRPGARPLIIFDELHKMGRFKSWLKGFYDDNRDDAAIWVTGSGRLDLYQKGGDSLLGRHFLYHMHPLTPGELQGRSPGASPEDPEAGWRRLAMDRVEECDIDALLTFGGFPEPFLKQEKAFHLRWIRTRRERITHEDVRDLTRIQDVDRLEHLVRLLNPRVASPLSINSLREDLGTAFETIQTWMSALERLYYIYGVLPYSRRLQRAITGARKYYFWDWSEVRDEGARFENLVMSHLLKACYTWTDFGLGEYRLWYIRDREKREVDALVTLDDQPWLMVEIRLSDIRPARPLIRFSKQLNCTKAVQVVKTSGVYRQVKVENDIFHVVSAGAFLSWLP
ncbi:MAG: ATP-binding protein [Desulfobacterales bacterium]|nr:ATP-binding protein [Desulfobacterales bacterium]